MCEMLLINIPYRLFHEQKLTRHKVLIARKSWMYMYCWERRQKVLLENAEDGIQDLFTDDMGIYIRYLLNSSGLSKMPGYLAS